ncbi:hypothetical protein BS17DRAFT_823430 [Gyrodon lividus]|nr:hypothetical protein BS17DRAFT_823430 [Gyrodon lividus]
MTSGTIFVDGLPIEEYRMEELRKCIAMLTQEHQALPVSVEENLGLREIVPSQLLVAHVENKNVWCKEVAYANHKKYRSSVVQTTPNDVRNESGVEEKGYHGSGQVDSLFQAVIHKLRVCMREAGVSYHYMRDGAISQNRLQSSPGRLRANLAEIRSSEMLSIRMSHEAYLRKADLGTAV